MRLIAAPGTLRSLVIRNVGFALIAAIFCGPAIAADGPDVIAAKPNVVQRATTAETVLVGGKILTMDAQDRTVAAVAIRGGRILATGSDAEVRKFVGKNTSVVNLEGGTVIPGIIAAHCHAVGVARNALGQPHVELLTIAEVQDWIRQRAKSLPPGTWIQVPRSDITRLKERRHPTSNELDAACSTHPVIFYGRSQVGTELAGAQGDRCHRTGEFAAWGQSHSRRRGQHSIDLGSQRAVAEVHAAANVFRRKTAGFFAECAPALQRRWHHQHLRTCWWH